jgi:hypothetical protein
MPISRKVDGGSRAEYTCSELPRVESEKNCRHCHPYPDGRLRCAETVNLEQELRVVSTQQICESCEFASQVCCIVFSAVLDVGLL